VETEADLCCTFKEFMIFIYLPLLLAMIAGRLGLSFEATPSVSADGALVAVCAYTSTSVI